MLIYVLVEVSYCWDSSDTSVLGVYYDRTWAEKHLKTFTVANEGKSNIYEIREATLFV